MRRITLDRLKAEKRSSAVGPEVSEQFFQAKLNELRNGLPGVASIESGVIRKSTSISAIEAAKQWITANITGPVQTEIGEVEVDAGGIADSLSHSLYQNKLDAIQAIVPVLQNGKFLGSLPDRGGKPINNYYFAGNVNIGGENKIVFVRTREKPDIQINFMCMKSIQRTK